MAWHTRTMDSCYDWRRRYDNQGNSLLSTVHPVFLNSNMPPAIIVEFNRAGGNLVASVASNLSPKHFQNLVHKTKASRQPRPKDQQERY